MSDPDAVKFDAPGVRLLDGEFSDVSWLDTRDGVFKLLATRSSDAERVLVSVAWADALSGGRDAVTVCDLGHPATIQGRNNRYPRTDDLDDAQFALFLVDDEDGDGFGSLRVVGADCEPLLEVDAEVAVEGWLDVRGRTLVRTRDERLLTVDMFGVAVEQLATGISWLGYLGPEGRLVWIRDGVLEVSSVEDGPPMLEATYGHDVEWARLESSGRLLFRDAGGLWITRFQVEAPLLVDARGCDGAMDLDGWSLLIRRDCDAPSFALATFDVGAYRVDELELGEGVASIVELFAYDGFDDGWTGNWLAVVARSEVGLGADFIDGDLFRIIAKQTAADVDTSVDLLAAEVRVPIYWSSSTVPKASLGSGLLRGFDGVSADYYLLGTETYEDDLRGEPFVRGVVGTFETGYFLSDFDGTTGKLRRFVGEDAEATEVLLEGIVGAPPARWQTRQWGALEQYDDFLPSPIAMVTAARGGNEVRAVSAEEATEASVIGPWGSDAVPWSARPVIWMDAITYLRAERRELSALLLASGLEQPIARNVSEYFQVDFPSDGLLYVVDRGDDAGIWFSKTK